jgi:hypothetical protein
MGCEVAIDFWAKGVKFMAKGEPGKWQAGRPEKGIREKRSCL